MQDYKTKALFKKVSKSDPKNYKPISLSKIIEKTIQIQTQEYLDKDGLFDKHQSGFSREFINGFLPCTTYPFYFERNGQSISHWDGPRWPTKSVWHIKSYRTFVNNGMYGFKESAIKWFQSYLPNKKFFVTLENAFSNARLIN